MTGPQWFVTIAAALFVLHKVYSMGKVEGIAIATRIIRDDLAKGPALVSAKGIVAELDKGLKALGKLP